MSLRLNILRWCSESAATRALAIAIARECATVTQRRGKLSLIDEVADTRHACPAYHRGAGFLGSVTVRDFSGYRPDCLGRLCSDTAVARVQGRLDAAFDRQLLQNVPDVNFDRRLGQLQGAGDAFVAGTA